MFISNRLRIITGFLFFFSSFLNVEAQQRPFVISGVPFYPFHFIQDEKPAGIFVDYIANTFSGIGVPYKIIITEAAGFDHVKKGTVDAVMSVGWSEEREGFMIFPEGFNRTANPKNYVWISSYHFFGLKTQESRFAHSSLAELRSKDPLVGVIKGISYHPDFWSQKFRVMEFETGEDYFKAVSTKKIDLFLIDRTVGQSILKRDKISTEIVFFPLAVFKRYYTLVLSKASTYPEKELVLKKFFEAYDRLKITSAAQDILLKYVQQ